MSAATSSPVLLGRFAPGSDDWHNARLRGIGGSEVAPILGLSPFESRFSLWFRKAHRIGPVEETEPMEWGNRLEPVVLAKFAEVHPEWEVTSAGTWHGPDRPWQIANPDGLVTDRATGERMLVEIKTARYGDEWGEPGTDEIPIYYRVQCLWYLDVFGLDACHVAVLIAGSEYREYVVTYDAAEVDQIRADVRAFLDTLENGERPDIDEHTATYQAIRELHPDIDGTDMELDDGTATAYVEARNRLKTVEGQEQLARSLLADAMGNAKTARWGEHTIARRQARKDGTPYVVAARNLPDLTGFTPNKENSK